MVSYGEFPFQIFEHDDEVFEEMKRIDILQKPFKDEDIASVSIPLYDKEHVYDDDNDIRVLPLVGRCIWANGFSSIYRDICDNDIECSITGGT